jgi:hypothetical protein
MRKRLDHMHLAYAHDLQHLQNEDADPTGAEQGNGSRQAELGEIDRMDRDASGSNVTASSASIEFDSGTICDFGTQICFVIALSNGGTLINSSAGTDCGGPRGSILVRKSGSDRYRRARVDRVRVLGRPQ